MARPSFAKASEGICFALERRAKSCEARSAKQDGWGGRIRTFGCRNQNPVPYHLATPQRARTRAGARTLLRGARAFNAMRAQVLRSLGERGRAVARPELGPYKSASRKEPESSSAW